MLALPCALPISPIFFDRKAWDGALACADVLLALLKEPCLQCLGLGLLVMAQGRNGIDQFGHPIRPQADSAAPTDRKSTRLTPVTNAHLVCRLLLEKKTTPLTSMH